MCNLSTPLSHCIRQKEPITYVLSKYSTRASVPSGVQPLSNVIPSVTSVSGRKASPSSMPQNNLVPRLCGIGPLIPVAAPFSTWTE